MKQLEGRVVSTKMKKTALVLVERKQFHPLYQKAIRINKKYPVQDNIGVKIGARVIIEASRPYSRNKSWKIVEVLK